MRYEYSVHGITPLSVSISGPSVVYHADPKGAPPNCYSWTANVSGGVAPYSYVWKKDGVQVGTASSYQECFGWNGYSGGLYQFTLRVDVTDAQSSTAFATKTVTAYNSTGDPWVRADDADLEISLPPPDDFGISQNYPNPFNPETEISFGLPEPSSVKITVIDVLGREIALLADREYSTGYQRVTWNGTDASGNKVGSGVYFYQIIATGQSGKQFTKVMKMALTK